MMNGCPYCGWQSRKWAGVAMAWVDLVNHMQTCARKPKDKPDGTLAG